MITIMKPDNTVVIDGKPVYRIKATREELTKYVKEQVPDLASFERFFVMDPNQPGVTEHGLNILKNHFGTEELA